MSQPQLPLELNTALTLQQQGQQEIAEQLCRQLLAREPNHAEGRYILGNLLLQQQRSEEALIEFQQALQQVSSNGDYWIGFTQALLALDRPREAFQTIDDLISKGLDWPAALELRERAREALEMSSSDPSRSDVSHHQPGDTDARTPRRHDELNTGLLPHWSLTIADGVKVCVPPDVRRMTTFVLLEQEDWFEAELPFLRSLVQPGMGVLDIGANHGVYALSLAKRLQGRGRVLACEPASAPAEMLARSIIENGFDSALTLLRLGLSDHQGEATLNISPNSELNSLSADADAPAGQTTETVRLITLDALLDSPDWPAGFEVDILKLDAEGEEIRILQGGERFFAEQDPLVLFEWKHGNQPNTGLLEAFAALDYQLYRLAPGLQALVPVAPDAALDGYQLNLFACKPSRAERLSATGHLVGAASAASELAPFSQTWPQALATLPYIAALRADGQALAIWQALERSSDPHWPRYEQALNAYLSASDPAQPLAMRWAWLQHSRALLDQLHSAGDGHLATILLRIRVLDASGARTEAVKANAELVEQLDGNLQASFDRPFLPPLADYDHRSPQGGIVAWVQAAIAEALELSRAYSAYFHGDVSILQRLADNPNRSLAMDRRRDLLALASGQRVQIKADSPLRGPTANARHRNVAWWQREMPVAAEIELAALTSRSNVDSLARPLLSICIPTYNRAAILQSTLEYLHSLLDERFEVVISDNASIDETQSVIKRFSVRFPHFRSLRQTETIPVGNNVLAAISSATSQFCYILSDDDEIYLDGLMAALQEMVRDEKIVAVYGGYSEWIRETGQLFPQKWVETPISFGIDEVGQLFDRFDLLWLPVMRTEIAQRHLSWPVQAWNMWTMVGELIRHGRISVIPEILYKHAHTVPRTEFKLVENWYHDMYRADYELFLARAFPGHPKNSEIVYQRTVSAYLQGVRFAVIQGMWERALFYLARARAYALLPDDKIREWQTIYLDKVIAESICRRLTAWPDLKYANLDPRIQGDLRNELCTGLRKLGISLVQTDPYQVSDADAEPVDKVMIVWEWPSIGEMPQPGQRVIAVADVRDAVTIV